MKVLFICKNNQFRSQMAAAMYSKITGTHNADSAGTYVGSTDAPEGDVIEKYFRTPDFFELMEENDMSIRNNRMKKLLPEMVVGADIIVTMAEEPFIPDFLRNNEKIILWNVENPPFATREVSEKTYSEIRSLVEKLISSSTN